MKRLGRSGVQIVWTKTLDEDFSEIPRNLFDALDGKTVMVTGATGLIGSLVIKALLYANENYRLSIYPVAVVRNLQKMAEVYGVRASSIETVCCDLVKEQIHFEGDVDFVVHGAAVTTSRIMVERPLYVIDLAINGTRAVLEFARIKTARVVYLSSMEVYGTLEGTGRADELNLGFINPLAVRSCYPESKRMCENLCAVYRVQYGIEVCIARLAQTFGAGVLRGENRAVVAFSRAASNGEDIVLKTQGLSDANYVYTSDAVAAVLTLMERGVPGEAYNVANETCHMSIADMAHLVIETVGTVGARVCIDVDADNSSGFAPDTHLSLDVSKLAALGWKPRVGMTDALRRLVAYLREVAES